MLTGTIKFIINVNDTGEFEVRSGSNEEISGDYKGTLPDEPMDLSAANKLLMYDSLAIMGFGSGEIITRVCVKRANCTWYCS